MPIHKTLNQDFFKIWTPEMAYVLGYFAADGSMLKNRRGGHYIEFTSTDRILLTSIKRVTGAGQQLSKRPIRDPRWKQQYRLQIGSKQWFEDLAALGFTQGKSNSMKFPYIPKHCMGSFIRGYFDGDGCVYFARHWSKWHKKEILMLLSLFTSGSKGFLEELHKLLRLYGVKGGRIARKTRGYELILSRRDSLALYRLMYNTASDPLPFLPRKRQKLERAIQALRLE